MKAPGLAIRIAGVVSIGIVSIRIGPLAQAAEPGDSSVQSGRSALGSHWSYPWYDESTDGIRVVDVEPADPAPAVREKSHSPSAGGATEVVVVIVGAAILGCLVWLLARAFLRAEKAAVVAESRSDREIDITRIEHLPFRVGDGKTDLLAEARRLYALQRYNEAMVYLYSHQLLQLDRLHVIHLTKGKTNRQYLREAARQQPHEAPAPASIQGQFAANMIAFEDVFFGHHELDRARFETCLANVERLAGEQSTVERLADEPSTASGALA